MLDDRPVRTLDPAARLYLDLLERTLTRADATVEAKPVSADGPGVRQAFKRRLLRELRARGLEVSRLRPVDPEARAEGRDWPEQAETMVGVRRLDNLRDCIVDVVERDVPGDIVETGVWRGGAMIFARAVLKTLGETERLVWCADSFEGLPPPDAATYPADEGDRHSTEDELAVSVEDVRANFARYGLLDDRVRFLKGWFRDTLPSAPIERIAVLRLDGDMYESTIVALQSLYDKVSPGGYVIVDDYGAVLACKQAVDDFRRERAIDDQLVEIDWTGSYWRRS
jgi:O-methyltransferase